MVNMPAIVTLFAERDGEILLVHIETQDRVVGCSKCGVIAALRI